MWDNLAKICDIAAPSGYETAVSSVAADLMKPLVNEIKTDALGNIFGYLPSADTNAPTIVLDAHLDEVGVMIAGYREGFAVLQNIGGLDPRILPAHGIRLLNGLRGVVAAMPPHVVSAAEADKAAPLADLLLDLGLGKADAERLAPVGTMGVFDSALVYRGESAMGKTLDDRAGFLVILRALELLRDKPLPLNVIVCGAVMEEVGGDGATVAAYGLAPDFAIAVDVTHAATPDSASHNTVKAGKGPSVIVGPICDTFMSKTLIKLAKERKIPYQIEVEGRLTSTDADDYQKSRCGVPTASIGVPLKYMHSPNEVLRRDDFENSARLLAAFLENFKPDCKGGDLA
ncbi:endoglucanase [Clostridia bacterium]|nr:endoglucanase [Clostridia bacterium]